jgi:gamma-tubulin complex component 5
VENATREREFEPTLFRLAYRGPRRATNTRSLECLSYLSLQYATPFPLMYVFGPAALETYSSIFVFVLQIRRAKHSLTRLLVRTGSSKVGRSVYVNATRLLWFVRQVHHVFSHAPQLTRYQCIA